MPALLWSDVDGIALALAEKFPDVDPLALRLTDLHRRITELADFADDPKASSEGKLEAIQMAWCEEREDR
jgi:FeS assembly protein IscX